METPYEPRPMRSWRLAFRDGMVKTVDAQDHRVDSRDGGVHVFRTYDPTAGEWLEETYSDALLSDVSQLLD